MGWDFKGELRRREYSPLPMHPQGDWTPRMYIAVGSNPYGDGGHGTNRSSWYEQHNGMLTLHGKMTFEGVDFGRWALLSLYGELLIKLPPYPAPAPVNYGTYQIVGHWALERFWGGGGYGHMELTRQYSGTPMLKMLINRYHDDSISILNGQVAPNNYLWNDSGLMFSIQYPVET